MARVTGLIQIEGRLGDVSFYKFKGVNYCKMTSRVSSHMLKHSYKFERFRQSGKRMGRATKFLSPLYHLLPEEQKVHGLFGKMAGEVYGMMRLEQSEAEIRQYIFEQYGVRQEEQVAVAAVAVEVVAEVKAEVAAVEQLKEFAGEKHLQRLEVEVPEVKEVPEIIVPQQLEAFAGEKHLQRLKAGVVVQQDSAGGNIDEEVKEFGGEKHLQRLEEFGGEKQVQRQRPSVKELLERHKGGISVDQLLQSLSYSGEVLTEEEVELCCLLEPG